VPRERLKRWTSATVLSAMHIIRYHARPLASNSLHYCCLANHFDFSQVVLLDDPSSCLDTESRQFMWRTLKKYSPGQTILLTTQCIAEAEHILDRVAFLSHGKIVCCDTPKALKEKYGEGTNNINACFVHNITHMS